MPLHYPTDSAVNLAAPEQLDCHGKPLHNPTDSVADLAVPELECPAEETERESGLNVSSQV